MFYVYILKINRLTRKYYIGYSGDLRKRINNHKAGTVKSTKNYLPIKLIYYEAFNDKNLALKREKSLKNSGSAYFGLMKRLRLKK